MNAQTALDEEVLDALRGSYICENSLVLPRPMDRRIYDKVNKVLNILGGVWNKGRKAHIFQEDAEPIITDAIASGVVVDLRKGYQFYETPEHTARKLVEMAGIGPGDRVLEPSAGKGAILRAILETKVGATTLEACEIWDKNRAIISEQGIPIVAEDFLVYNPGHVYDVIIANPPFTRGQDITHVFHMWELLAPRGRLVSVMSPAWTFRKTRQAEEFREFVQRVGGEWKLLDSDAFAGNGASARTGILFIRSPIEELCEHGFPDGMNCLICDTDGRAEACGYLPPEEKPEIKLEEEEVLDDGAADEVDLERIKLRIAKMLSLGDQEKSKTTQAEAEVALSRAQELMVRYNITREQAMNAKTVIEEEWVLKVVLATRSRPLEILYIMPIITGHFLVEMFETRTLPTSQFTWARSYSIYGRASNVDVAEYILNYLRPVFRELWGAYRKELLAAGWASHQISRREIRTYFRGLASGLSVRLRKERDRFEESTTTALVRIAEDVRAKANEEFKLGTIKTKGEGGSSTSFSRGYDDARKVSLHRGIEEKKTKQIVGDAG